MCCPYLFKGGFIVYYPSFVIVAKWMLDDLYTFTFHASSKKRLICIVHIICIIVVANKEHHLRNSISMILGWRYSMYPILNGFINSASSSFFISIVWYLSGGMFTPVSITILFVHTLFICSTALGKS